MTGEADALRGAVRFFGNRGLFAFTGWFWSRRLGRFRAFATDPGRAVMLRYADRKVIVTPHDPQHLIVRLRTLMGSLAHQRDAELAEDPFAGLARMLAVDVQVGAGRQ